MDRKNFIERHIELATKVAYNGDHWQHRIGAVLCQKGKIISTGANSFKTHKLMGFKTLHGEIQALIGVRYRDLRGSVLFVSRISRQGKIGMSKPCSTCENILRKYGIKKVFYTTSTGVGELRLS
jgi:deoxycytidylate deaminase